MVKAFTSTSRIKGLRNAHRIVQYMYGETCVVFESAITKIGEALALMGTLHNNITITFGNG